MSQLSALTPRRPDAPPDADAIDVSVCIVNWNCRELLAGCLESLLDREQGVYLEVIVVDNASRDGAADLVEQRFPEVVQVRNPSNLGFARANNQAARLARGRYLFFLNNDTVVPPGTLRRLLDHAGALPEVGILGPRLRDGRGELQFSYRRRPTVAALLHRTTLLRWTGLFRRAYRRGRREQVASDAPRPVEVLMGAAMLVPREVFRRWGPWDEGYTFGGEDMDLCLRIGRHRAVVYLPAVEVIHHGRASTRLHLEFTSAHIPAGFVRYLRRSGSWRVAVVVYQLALTLDAPVCWLAKALQYLWRRARGQHVQAEKSRLAMRTASCLLRRGLLPLWKA